MKKAMLVFIGIFTAPIVFAGNCFEKATNYLVKGKEIK